MDSGGLQNASTQPHHPNGRGDSKNMLTRSSQNLVRPGEGWAQPFCNAFELHCHFVVEKKTFCRVGGWSPYKMRGHDPTGVMGRGDDPLKQFHMMNTQNSPGCLGSKVLKNYYPARKIPLKRPGPLYCEEVGVKVVSHVCPTSPLDRPLNAAWIIQS